MTVVCINDLENPIKQAADRRSGVINKLQFKHVANEKAY